jgi:ketosteroid isomerase-like protein
MSRLTADDLAAIERAAEAYADAMRAENWELVARSFAGDAVRIPPHEEPHRGRDAIRAWLGGVEELAEYQLTRDVVDGADGFAYARGRYAVELRLAGVPATISDQGDFLEIWRKEADGEWRIAEAIWNTRVPVAT